jgi:bleomycin hydrolase
MDTKSAETPRSLFAVVIAVVVLSFGTSAQSLEQALQDAIMKLPHPEAVSDFQPLHHLSPLNQDSTLICWSFSTSSFLESEMERLGMEPVRLSVVYPVYYAFVEKAKRYIQTHGASRFAPGDLFTGVLDIVREYGAIPAEAYGNKIEGTNTFNQTALYRELSKLIERVKKEGLWNEKNVVPQVRRILDRHLGAPPTRFTWKGKTYTPQTFVRDVIRLPWESYVLVTSFQYAPFGERTELKVPDNWRRNDHYENVPLEVFYNSMKDALQAGYSLALDADISEPSYERTKRYAFIPSYDIPAKDITQEAREFRFVTEATTDDHLVHAIDYRSFGGEDWFLVKDSWRTAWEPGSSRGYMFFHGSYMKLKVLAYLVHRDAVPEVRKAMEETKQ